MRHFSARETAWLQELDGIELAGFRRRAFAFMIDWIIVGLLGSILATAGTLAFFGIARAIGHPIHISNLDLDTGAVTVNTNDTPSTGNHVNVQRGLPGEGDKDHPKTFRERVLEEALKIFADIVLPVLYFGILTWRGKGQTPGKRWMKIRVVSIVHPHLTFWHSVERALGYGAAALEAGFGFFQFWIHPYRRCAQDRLAETIVVTEGGYQKMISMRNTSAS